jgi:hypothetical protein
MLYVLIMVVGSGSEDQLYIRFMEARCCYEAMPYSSKLVVFDTQLSVSVTRLLHLCSNLAKSVAVGSTFLLM